jgi:MFS family permease
LIVSISAALSVDRLGRRPLFLTAISGMVVSFALWTAMAGLYESHNKAQGFGIAQIVFIWVFGIFYSIGFSGLLVAYTLEVLPFHLRAKGIMIMNITVQAILAISAQTNPVAIENLPHAWNFWLFYTVSPTIPLLEGFEICSNIISLALELRRGYLGLLHVPRNQGPYPRGGRQDFRW